MKPFAQILARYKKSSGRSWEDIGNEIGQSREAVRQWALNMNAPPADALPALSRLLGLDYYALLGELPPNLDITEDERRVVSAIRKLGVDPKDAALAILDLPLGPAHPDTRMRQSNAFRLPPEQDPEPPSPDGDDEDTGLGRGRHVK